MGLKKADDSIAYLGYVLHCFNCLNRKSILGLVSSIDRRCDICGGEMDFSGPLWLGPLADRSFCTELVEAQGNMNLGSRKRLSKLLPTILGESEMPPTFFTVDKICEKLGLRTVSRDSVIAELVDMGYRAVKTHFTPQGIKSDAPTNVIREVIRNL